MLLTVVIAVVVVFSIGLLIGVTSMHGKVKNAEHRLEVVADQFEEFRHTVYNNVNFQINLLRCNVLPPPKWLTNTQRKRLRRLGSQLLRIKDIDEDHTDRVEGQ